MSTMIKNVKDLLIKEYQIIAIFGFPGMVFLKGASTLILK